MELIDARGELAVFDVRHPSVGNVIFPVMPILRDLLALFLHIACSQSKADAQFLQPLSGTRTRLTCVHWRGTFAILFSSPGYFPHPHLFPIFFWFFPPS